MNGPVRILIVDDHGIVRAGVQSLLESESDLELVAQAADGPTAIERAREFSPDVAIVDLEMPGMSGVEVIESLRTHCPGIKSLVLTMHDDPVFIRAAMEAGCSGYVVKEAVGSELIAAIHVVHGGRSYFNVSQMSNVLAEQDAAESKSTKPEPMLSRREREVLELLAQGFTNQEAGKKLRLSDRTIATYRARIGEKLGLRTRADIVRYALAHGILRVDRPAD